jgi:hypothetical protein
MPDPRFITVFAFVLAFLPVDVRAQDYQALDKTYAQIRQIEDDGSLILENNARIRLWGLEIVNAERMRELLTGQSVSCLLIGKSDTQYLSDCTLYPRNQNGWNESFRLDLFVWLQEFDVALPQCSAAEVRLDGRRHAFGYQYLCPQGGTPARSPLSAIIR